MAWNWDRQQWRDASWSWSWADGQGQVQPQVHVANPAMRPAEPTPASSATPDTSVAEPQETEEDKQKRIRKTKPGPKDASQARREQIHRLTLDLKAEREKNSDLRGAHETAMKLLKLEMTQNHEKEQEKWMAQSKASEEAIQRAGAKITELQNTCAQWQTCYNTMLQTQKSLEQQVTEAHRDSERKQLALTKDKNEQIDKLKEELARAKDALNKATEQLEREIAKDMPKAGFQAPFQLP